MSVSRFSPAATPGTPVVNMPLQLFDPRAPLGTPASRFYAEDGWLFREYPGKRVEVVGRYQPAVGGCETARISP